MDIDRLRAWWWRKQGLDGSLAEASCADVLSRSGWARSVGGVTPYLTLFSRAGIGREAADAAVAALEIHELPAARGCTYVVPAADFGLALLAGAEFREEEKTAAKLGVTARELDVLAAKVIDIVKTEAKDPDRIKAEAGGSVRNLGDEGKKRGLSTTLPVVLGKLQADGEIRRIPVNGRLDQQRYRYIAWPENPLRSLRLSPEEVYTELAHRFFRWIGPASVDEFRRFAGLGATAARQIVSQLNLVEAAETSGRLIFRDELEAWRATRVPRHPQYALLGSVDALTLLRRDLLTLLDAYDADTKVLRDKSPVVLGGLGELPSHAIVDRGRVVGLWEFDTEENAIVWTLLSSKPDAAVCEAVAQTAGFVRTQLGDARAFSLDSPKSREPRIASFRKAFRT